MDKLVWEHVLDLSKELAQELVGADAIRVNHMRDTRSTCTDRHTHTHTRTSTRTSTHARTHTHTHAHTHAHKKDAPVEGWVDWPSSACGLAATVAVCQQIGDGVVPLCGMAGRVKL